MARDGRTLPARRQRDAFDESVLVRSAETLGRMIGALQRQLDGATKKLAASNGNWAGPSRNGNAPAKMQGRKVKTAPAKKPPRTAAGTGTGAARSGEAKNRSTADRKSKGASTSTAVKKTAGRKNAGSRQPKKSRSAS
jgi:hypothetical protein